MRALLAAGGTGGHMFPAQALAEELLTRGWTVALASDDRGLRYAGGFPKAVERRALKAATTARGGLLGKVKAPFALMAGTVEASRWVGADRPDVVIGFGGYPAAPALAAAVLRRVPRMIHEQNGVLGRANRLFAKRCAVIACGFAAPANAPAGVPQVVTGNPIRAQAAQLAGLPYMPPGAGPLRLVAFGGSQGASAVSQAVLQAVAQFDDDLRGRLQIVQQAREDDAASVRAAYAAAGVAAEVASFFEDMPDRIATAHLVIARAGASTCAEICAIGRPSILIPLPSAANDHQTANARALSDAGAARLLPQAELSGKSIAAEIERLLVSPDSLAAMARAARGLARPNAAADLADLVARVAAGDPIHS